MKTIQILRTSDWTGDTFQLSRQTRDEFGFESLECSSVHLGAPPMGKKFVKKSTIHLVLQLLLGEDRYLSLKDAELIVLEHPTFLVVDQVD